MKLFVAVALMIALSSTGPPAVHARGSSFRVNAEQVRHVQQRLNDLGYRAGAVDGVLGPRTESALRRFQKASNLDPTGQLDTKTLAALDREPTGHPVASVVRHDQPPVETPQQERRRLIPESEPE
jgi:peptidoglycan hydrolase-like protein with peptidoglycan-binding domain